MHFSKKWCIIKQEVKNADTMETMGCRIIVMKMLLKIFAFRKLKIKKLKEDRLLLGVGCKFSP